MTKHHLEIRLARDADLAAVLALERTTPTAPHWSAEEYEGILHQRGEIRRCLFVASDGTGVCGFAVGSIVDAEAELESVTVADSLRRQGLGTALCRAVMDWCEREGAAAIMLEVRANSSGAITLYSGIGFVAIGRRPGYYHDPPDDAIVMRCALRGDLMTK